MFKQSLMSVSNLGSTLRGAGNKLLHSVSELQRHEDEASTWLQRFIAREVASRVAARDRAPVDPRLAGASPEERASRRIRSVLVRGTVVSAAASVGASSAAVLSVLSDGAAVPGALPLGLFSVLGEMFYTTALQIELAVDLASIYGVPFQANNVGELSTLLGLAVGVDLVREPSSHDAPGAAGGTKPWRVQRQMQRNDFSRRVGFAVIQQSVLRNIVPIAGVLVSAVWNHLQLRRFAGQVHTLVRQRRAIVDASSGVQLTDPVSARIVLDGAWLLATADGELGHQEALALSTLIDNLGLPQRIDVNESSFNEDQEGWFVRVRELDEEARRVLVNVLALVAGADGEFTLPERRMLERLAHTLGGDVDLAAIERTVARLRAGQRPLEAAPSSAPADAALPAAAPAPA